MNTGSHEQSMLRAKTELHSTVLHWVQPDTITIQASASLLVHTRNTEYSKGTYGVVEILIRSFNKNRSNRK